jgi:hypothetical protein
MKRNHAVKEQIILAFGDYLGLVISGDEQRELLQMCANKIPDSIFSSSFELEAIFQAAVRLIS